MSPNYSNLWVTNRSSESPAITCIKLWQRLWLFESRYDQLESDGWKPPYGGKQQKQDHIGRTVERTLLSWRSFLQILTSATHKRKARDPGIRSETTETPDSICRKKRMPQIYWYTAHCCTMFSCAFSISVIFLRMSLAHLCFSIFSIDIRVLTPNHLRLQAHPTAIAGTLNQTRPWKFIQIGPVIWVTHPYLLSIIILTTNMLSCLAPYTSTRVMPPWTSFFQWPTGTYMHSVFYL